MTPSLIDAEFRGELVKAGASIAAFSIVGFLSWELAVRIWSDTADPIVVTMLFALVFVLFWLVHFLPTDEDGSGPMLPPI